ncbi:MAG: DUF3592 domain-containing protein [Bryobacteraceae bacterium]|jgi:hypothetical protein
MGIFFIFFGLFPYLIGQLHERWVRRVANKWIKRDAIVTAQTITDGWTAHLEIRYQFKMNGELHEGKFQRRFLTKSSAESEPVYEPGASIQVLVDPENPTRSYFPLPLGVWGLLYAAPIVALAIVAALGGLASGLDQRRFEAKHRIPESEWKRIRYSRLFDISFPGDSSHGTGTAGRMAIDGNIPRFDTWLSGREGFAFTAALYQYPDPPAPDRIFALVRTLNAEGFRWSAVVERPLVYASQKARRPVTWPGSKGRLLKHSHPDWAMEVYVSERSVYLISTNWPIPSDVSTFFDSLQPTVDPY